MKHHTKIRWLLPIALLLICLAALSGCKQQSGECVHQWTDATCTTPKTCSVCNETEGEALGHKWVDATCTTPKTCSVCNETEGEALGHKWVDATCTTPKTCSVCNETEGDALGHKWVDATCTTPKTCSVCQTTEGEALGHKWVDATCTTPKTCSVCNETEGEALGHKWVDATCTTPKTCSVCNETEGEALGHKWVDATCTTPKTCSVCNETEGEALGHKWVDATCTTPKTCSVCNETEGEALGHKWVDATCTTPKTCSVCGITEGAALEHQWIEATCTTPKTCADCGTTEGKAEGHVWFKPTCTKPKTCYICGETMGSPLDHKWVGATCTTPKTCSICKKTEGDTTGHMWLEATCTSPKTCSVCKQTEGDTLGHIWTDATCTSPKTCSVCHKTEGNALGHTWVNATCTAPRTCSVCNETEGVALGHVWNDATCTAPKTCSICNQSEGVALGHTWVNATCTTPRTCSVCNETEGVALGHTWIDATCTTPKTCSVCQATEGEALGHTWVNATCTTPKTCSVCNETEGDALGHKWVDATCTTAKTCSVCNETEGNALGHAWTEWSYANGSHTRFCLHDTEHAETGACLGGTATCEKPAVCEVCNHEYGEKLGHSFGDWVITTPAGCTAAGEQTATCTACGTTKTDSVPAIGHSYIAVVTAPTCTAQGYTTNTCWSCGDEQIDTYVNPTGHNWDIPAPTCEQNQTCITCQEAVDALGHNYVLIGSTAADCTAAQIDHYECPNCGNTQHIDVGAPLAHNISGVTPTLVPVDGKTCDFVQHYACVDCGSDVAGSTVVHHDQYTATITTHATCTVPGVKTLSCTACGFEKTEDIPIDTTLGHTWVEGTPVGNSRIDTCSSCTATKNVTVLTADDKVNVGDLKDTEISLENGANITLGNAADNIGDKDVTISVDTLTDDDKKDLGLDADQLAQVGDNPIYNFVINDGKQDITDFGDDGFITVTLPYVLEPGENVDNIAVWYIDDNGELTSIPATYNNGYVTFRTNHFSYYTVTRLTPKERCELYGHNYTTTDVAATCTEAGYTLSFCIRCAHSEKTVTAEAIGHTYETHVTPATCTAAGSTEYICGVCTHTYSVSIPALRHNWVESSVTPATCTAPGQIVYVCVNDGCSLTKTETYAQLSHHMVDTVVPATCVEAGYTLHACSNDGCTYSYRDNFVETLRHRYVCAVEWNETYTGVSFVIRCENDINNSHSAIYDKIEITKRIILPDCTSYGAIEYVARVTHNGQIYEDIKSIPYANAYSHAPGREWSFHNESHWHVCRRCDEPVELGAHDFGEGIILKDASCTEDGMIRYTCLCGFEKTAVIPATGEHHYQNGTCTDCGRREFDFCEIHTPKTLITRLHDGNYTIITACEICEWSVERTTQTAAVEYHSDSDSYYAEVVFEPAKTDIYTILSASVYDTYVTLYILENGELIPYISNDNSGHYGNFSLSMMLEAGVTYVYRIASHNLRQNINIPYILEQNTDDDSSCGHGTLFTYQMLPSGASSCVDGVIAMTACAVCGDIHSMGVTDSHEAFTEESSIDLTEFNACYGYVITSKCLCGEITQCAFDFCFDSETTDSFVDEQGIHHRVQSLSCSICGLNAVSDIYTLREGCFNTDYRDLTISMGNTVVATVKGIFAGSHPAHTYEQEAIFDADANCQNGVSILYTCTVCGDSYSEHFYDHITFPTVNLDLAEHGACHGYFRAYRCPCGQNEWVEYYDCHQQYTHNDYEDENGVHHDVRVYTCSTCDLVLIRDQYTLTEGCYNNTYRTFTISVGGTVLLDEYTALHYRSENHRYTYSFTFDADQTCENGVQIHYTCTACGDSYSNHVFHHEILVLENINATEIGGCYGSVTTYSCPCGKEKAVDYHLCYDTEDVSFYTDDHGREHMVVTRTCTACSMTHIIDQYFVREGCFRNTYTTLTVAMGDTVLVDSFTYQSSITELHTYNYTVTYHNGVDCTDGYIAIGVCTACGREIESHGYSHDTLPIYMYDNESISCGHHFYHESCPCGKNVSIYFDGYHLSASDSDFNFNCRTCGLSVTSVVTDSIADCQLDRAILITVMRNGELMYETTLHSAFVHHNIHSSVTVLADGNYRITTACSDCGLVTEQTTARAPLTYREDISRYCYDLYFTPSESGLYTITSMTSGDTYVELFLVENGELVYLTSNDDGAPNNNFLLTRALEANTTYVYRMRYYGGQDGNDIQYMLGMVSAEVESCHHANSTTEYILVDGATSCTQGFFAITGCRACLVSTNLQFFDHHVTHETDRINFSDYGACHGYIYTVSCACGETIRGNIDYCYDSQSTEHYTDNHGIGHTVYTYACSSCGLQVTRDVYTVTEGCYQVNYCIVSASIGDTVIVDNRLIVTSRQANHSYTYTFTFDSEENCESGVRVDGVCTNCGTVTSEHIFGHNQYVIHNTEMAHLGACYGYLVIYTCPCGENTAANYHFCYDTTDVSTYTDSNGIIHIVRTYRCSSCRLTHVCDEYSVLEGCTRKNYRTLTVTKDNNLILDSFTYIYNITYEHDYTNTFTFDADQNCENGVYVERVCNNCQETSSRHYNHHVELETERYDLSEYGSTCGGYLWVFSCPCGQHQGINQKFDYTDYSSNVYDDEEGRTHYVEVRTCALCNLRYQIDSYTLRDPATCRQVTYYTVILNVGSQLVANITYETSSEAHDYTISGRLDEGSTNCEDGAVITYTCRDCGHTFESHVYHHEQFISERLALTDPAYGSAVCTGYANIMRCACGKYMDVQLDSQCNFDTQYTPCWIDGYVEGYITNVNSEHYISTDSYMYVCAVTDPTQCAYRIRYARYYLPVEGECRLEQYMTWQFGYDPVTDTCAYEFTTKLGYAITYHPYEHERIYEVYENGQTKTEGDLYTCPDCGSYYYDQVHYTETGLMIVHDRLWENLLDNGEAKLKQYYYEYGTNGMDHIELNRYIDANGVETWHRYEYLYNLDYVAPFGDNSFEYICNISNSDGYHRTEKIAETNYCGYRFEIYREYSENGYTERYDHTYSFEGSCERTTHYSNSNGENNTYVESCHPAFYWDVLIHPTCTQPGLEAEHCPLCMTTTYENEIEPYDHNWHYIAENRYVCTRCGMKNENGASGDIVIEDYTNIHGDEDSYALGYWAKNNVQFLYYVSLILHTPTESGDNEVILEGIDIFELSDVRGLYFSKSAVADAAEALGYTPDMYDVRFSFVPVGADGSFDYAITFTGDGSMPEEDLDYAVMWDVSRDVVLHQSFDELRINGTYEGVFSPGASYGWNKVAHMTVGDTLLQYWGWIAINGEIGQFGYQIDSEPAVFDDRFIFPAERPVLDAAEIFGADNATRMLIDINIAGLSVGRHNVRVYYTNAQGHAVLLNEFSVVISENGNPGTDTGTGLPPNLSGTPGQYVSGSYESFKPVGDMPITWNPNAQNQLNLRNGNLSDWTSLGLASTHIDTSNMVSWIHNTTMTNWSADAYLMADAENLYMAFYFADPSVVPCDPGNPGNYASGDCIQMSIDIGHKQQQAAKQDEYSSLKSIFYSFAFNGHGGEITVFVQESNNDRLLSAEDGVIGSTGYTEDGWCAELAIPWRILVGDYIFKNGIDENTPAGKFPVSASVPLELGVCLNYINHSFLDDGSSTIDWAAGTHSGFTGTDDMGSILDPAYNPPQIRWDICDNGINMVLHYVDGMAFNCANFTVDSGVKLPDDMDFWHVQKNPVIHHSVDELRTDLGDHIFTPGQSGEWDRLVQTDDSVDFLTYFGWVALFGEVGSFGYQIDNNPPIFKDAFAITTEQDVIDAAVGCGADTGARLSIDIHVVGITGSHVIRTFYQSPDGAFVILDEFVLYREKTEIQPPEQTEMINFAIEELGSNANSVSIAGWVGFNRPITAFGWTIDGNAVDWNGSINYNPENVIKDIAGEHAIRFSADVHLSDLSFGDHIVAFYVSLDDGSVFCLHEEYLTIRDTSHVGNATFNFDSAIDGDLTQLFTFTPAVSPESCHITAAPYKMSGINQLILTSDGTYALSLTNFRTLSTLGTLILRGNPLPHFGDANYFGHDGNQDISFGCAGVYVGIITENGSPILRINVKENGGDFAIPHVYKIPMNGYDLTVTDDNHVLTFYEGETVLATVELSGNNNGYATQAIVTLADGTTEVLSNLAVAASAMSDIGFASRTGDVTFDAIKLTSLAAFEGWVSWDDNRDVITYLSFDELRGNGDSQNGVFQPGTFPGWNHFADVDTSLTYLQAFGWVAIYDEAIGTFGYCIGDNEPVFHDAWTAQTEDPVIQAALSVPHTKNASRFRIDIDISEIIGTQLVKILYKNPDGKIVVLAEFTVNRHETNDDTITVNGQEFPAPSYDFWTTWRDVHDYSVVEGESSKPNAGFAYTDEGFKVTSPDFTGTITKVNAQTSQPVDIRNGFFMEIRVDRYSYKGDSGGHDQWIAFSLSDTPLMMHGSTRWNNNWLGLIRGTGNGTADLQIFITDVSGNTFVHLGTVSLSDIPMDQGHEIYTFEVNTATNTFTVNGVSVPGLNQGLAHIAGFANNSYVGVTFYSGQMAGVADFTITKQGTSSSAWFVPTGTDSREPEIKRDETQYPETESPETEPPETEPPVIEPVVPGTIVTPEAAGLIQGCVDYAISEPHVASICGWIGYTQPINAMGWAVDHGEIVWNGEVNYQPEDAVKNHAGEYAVRYSINATFDSLPYGDHTVVFYMLMKDGSIVYYYELHMTIAAPTVVGDASFNFDSAVDEDMSTLFTFTMGIAAEDCSYHSAPYKMSGINQLVLTSDGKYALSLTNFQTQTPFAALVLRGNPLPHFGDPNYFGHDGNNDMSNPDSVSFGCAGVYVSILTENGAPVLRINVKGNEGGIAIPHVYKIPMNSYDLTITDDNHVLTFYEGGVVLATVALSGNDQGYATEAIVTLADGTTDVLNNLAVAATAVSDIGFIARAADVTFDAIKLTSLSNYNASVGPETEDAADAIITFTDINNRLEFSAETQVWAMNGITVTNNKGASATDISDYYDPIRCYTSSELTIAYTGMTRIVITTDYKNLSPDFAISTGTLTVEGEVATITFDAPVDSVTFSELNSQIRISEIQVYTA